MNALHDNNYDIGKAVLSLITSLGPMLCKDELEEWSAAEANLFEDALEKYGKDFVEIRKDYVSVEPTHISSFQCTQAIFALQLTVISYEDHELFNKKLNKNIMRSNLKKIFYKISYKIS